MPPDLSSEAWAQIRHDYEHSERPVEEICAEYGISSGTLRDRMRRWGWTRRRTPIPPEGPPPAPAPQTGTAAPARAAAPQPASGEGAPTPPPASGEHAPAPDTADESAIVPRLESAVARVLPAIEAILAQLAAAPAHPREMERAARALAALTRTLRELNGLLRQRQAAAVNDPRAWDDDMPADIDAFRIDLARRIDAFVTAHTGQAKDGTVP